MFSTFAGTDGLPLTDLPDSRISASMYFPRTCVPIFLFFYYPRRFSVNIRMEYIFRGQDQFGGIAYSGSLAILCQSFPLNSGWRLA